MTGRPMHPRLEGELTAHVHALRAMARLLVGDVDADDLVQDTALQALQTPPMRTGGLRGWLVLVLRRLASNHRRGRARRQRREQLVPPAEDAAPAARIAEHKEAVRRVTDALLALPEPYQGTLILRFFEELTPTAIAAQTKLPLATVKSRLQRGLTMLREQLDAEKRKDWRPALAAFGVGRTAVVGATGAAITTTGVWLMGTGMKVAIGGAAAVVLATAVWVFPRADAPSSTSAVAAAVPETAAVPAAGPPPVDAPERREVLGATTKSADAPATWRGRCIDERGQPIVGVTVQLFGRVASSERLDAWTKDHAVPERIDAQTKSGSDGTFAFHLWPPPPFSFVIMLEGQGLASMSGDWSAIAPGAALELGDVVMPPGCEVRGRVLEGDRPVAGASVTISSPQRGNGEIQPRLAVQAMSLADGTLVTNGRLPAGEYSVQVTGRTAHPETLTLEGTQAVVDVTIFLDRLAPGPPTISGVVVDEQGEPIAEARVGLRMGAWRDPRSTVATDRTGHFRLPQPARAEREVLLLAEAPGREAASPDQAFAWGTTDVRLVLRSGLSVTVNVVAADNSAPVEDFQLRVFPANASRIAGEDFGARVPGHHPGGRVVVDGIRRGAWCVLVEPKGDALAMSAFVPVNVTDPGPSVIVRLPRMVERVLHVQFADGSPAAATKVQLTDTHGRDLDARTIVRPLTTPSWGDGYTALLLQEVTTDTRGEATLRGASDVPLTLFVRGPGHVPTTQGGVLLGDDGPLTVTVSRGASVVGVIGPARLLTELRRLGNVPTEGSVEENLRDLLPRVELLRTVGGRYITYPESGRALVDDSGAFALHGAPSGRWHVRVTWNECVAVDAQSTSYSGVSVQGPEVDLRDEATAEVDLDLSYLMPGELEALVLVNGVPAANHRFPTQSIVGKNLFGADDVYTRYPTTDGEGRFHLRTRPGTYWLEDWGRVRSMQSDERVAVVTGQTTTQTFHLQSGKLRFHLLDATDKPVANAKLDLGDPDDPRSRQRSSIQPTDAEGWAEVEAGVRLFTISILPKRLQGPKAQQDIRAQHSGPGDPFAGLHLELGVAMPKAGETTELTLHVPPDWDR
jgi:RNA polymerase sigma-70 factor (ECF subfamily)